MDKHYLIKCESGTKVCGFWDSEAEALDDVRDAGETPSYAIETYRCMC